MAARRCHRGGLRSVTTAAVVAALVAASGCGGGGDEPSKEKYYSSIDTFCGKVAAAARAVSDDTSAVQKDRNASASKRYKAVTASLTRFADSTETALKKLEDAGVPAEFKAYQDGTSKGFRTFISTLRTTAAAAEKDAPEVLAKLESRLNAVKLPDPPTAITQNAKACAEFTPAG